jgi:transcriptional regulator with XRE-family HTH domain
MSKTFGSNLKRIRLSRGLSQSAIARGQSQSFISQVEAGKFQPTKDYIKHFCKVLDCTEEELFRDNEVNETIHDLKKVVEELKEQVNLLSEQVRRLMK